ncbi:MAG: 30S ribosomal protein S15 [Planctomycetes bacterium]|nr:30S ribosomal protein S15 [Planctomycetota bacterium]
MANKNAKLEVIKKFARHETDTGSTEVQVASLTQRINQLSEHLKVYKKDFNSRRGLLMMVGQRNKLLKYLQEEDQSKYKTVIKELGLRK